ncbi:3-hydroxybutyryl-CoA dehydrogenase [Streptomyces albidoflavus]|uniref:3-hydroxybutyryl-CoA dehydrogenase n=1 Tax=Streptomyces albidoflavus TaxID=1886 RepID=UPI002F910D7B|nr:3-hydroxybutyryl-CoA dehydrogenase [Streptomyces albidoflavus]
MSAPVFERIGVLGGGLMGAGIAEVCARSGAEVRVVVTTERSRGAARARLERSAGAAAAKGRISAEEHDAILSRVSFGTDLGELADRQLVLESVTEDENTKVKLFRQLDAVLTDPGAVVTTNTSSLPVTRLAEATDHPGRLIGTHFFNPVPAMPLVEITATAHTPDATVARVAEFVTAGLGKEAIRSTDRAGFVVNALLVPYLLAAARMAESGHADAADIDKGMTLGCGHPMGPLRLADLVGIDTLRAVAAGLYEESGDPAYAPPEILTRMVEAGHRGQKAGRGFHTYT